MKNRKPLAALLLVPALLLTLALPAAAAEDVSAEATTGARWLEAACPSPAVGDEAVVFTLLRGGYITGIQDYTQGYLQQLLAHVQNGGSAGQTMVQTGWQLLALAAAGVDIAAEAPALAAQLAAREGLDAEGAEAQRMALLVFGTAKVAQPEGQPLDLSALAADYANTRNPDGGFGPGGVSNVVDTSRAIQALATFSAVPGVEDALIYAQFWQQQNASMYGGFDMDGQASAIATAEAILSMNTLGYDPAYISDESASMTDALRLFQNEDGGFSANPDSQPDMQLSATCLLALTAKVRYDRGKTNVFDCSDATPTGIAPPSSTPQQPGSVPAASTPGESPQNPAQALGLNISTPVLLLILGGIVVLVVVLAIALTSRGRRNKKKKRRAAAQNQGTKKYTHRLK